MKTLDEFNKERASVHEMHQSHQNGISCPSCGQELWDTYPNMTLTSNPPQKNVHCICCGYTGYRIA